MHNHTKNSESRAVFQAILSLRSVEECENFFHDLLTTREIKEMTTRFKIARELNRPKRKSYMEIAKDVGTSTATVTRVAHWLRTGAGGYKLILERLKDK